MIRKLGPMAVTLMLVGIFAAGCGGDDKSDSSSSDAPATTAETTVETVTSEDTTTTDDADSSDLADNPQVKQAIASCKDSIETNPQVKDDVKEDLKAVCDKAATGDPEDVKAAIKEVCQKIVESSVPEGDVRDQALSACDAAG